LSTATRMSSSNSTDGTAARTGGSCTCRVTASLVSFCITSSSELGTRHHADGMGPPVGRRRRTSAQTRTRPPSSSACQNERPGRVLASRTELDVRVQRLEHRTRPRGTRRRGCERRARKARRAAGRSRGRSPSLGGGRRRRSGRHPARARRPPRRGAPSGETRRGRTEGRRDDERVLHGSHDSDGHDDAFRNIDFFAACGVRRVCVAVQYAPSQT
jgi:hypothetical protein